MRCAKRLWTVVCGVCEVDINFFYVLVVCSTRRVYFKVLNCDEIFLKIWKFIEIIFKEKKLLYRSFKLCNAFGWNGFVDESPSVSFHRVCQPSWIDHCWWWVGRVGIGVAVSTSSSGSSHWTCWTDGSWLDWSSFAQAEGCRRLGWVVSHEWYVNIHRNIQKVINLTSLVKLKRFVKIFKL